MDHRTIVDAEELLLSALVAATPEGAPGRAEVRCELEQRALLRYLMRRNEERLADALFRESSGPFTFALGWDRPAAPVTLTELQRAVVRAGLMKRASAEAFVHGLSLLPGADEFARARTSAFLGSGLNVDGPPAPWCEDPS